MNEGLELIDGRFGVTAVQLLDRHLKFINQEEALISGQMTSCDEGSYLIDKLTDRVPRAQHRRNYLHHEGINRTVESSCPVTLQDTHQNGGRDNGR